MKKIFLCIDQTGRELAVSLPIDHIQKNWDMEYKNDPDSEWDETFGEWLENANLGDEFRHEDDREKWIRVS